jgi:Na+/melibiose symporter-like transporter
MILWATGFPSTALPGKVDPAIVYHFAVFYIFAVAAIYGIGFFILSYFPIDRESHAENLRQLAAEHAQANESVDMGVEP